jgi:hypothetical protein
VERAVFLTVLHRPMDPGSDRAAEKWKQDFRIEGAQAIEELLFARRLGERTTKDRIEESGSAGP